MEPDDLLCSCNAHDKNVPVRRAHSRIDQAALRRDRQANLEGPFMFMVARCASVRIDWDNPEK